MIIVSQDNSRDSTLYIYPFASAGEISCVTYIINSSNPIDMIKTPYLIIFIAFRFKMVAMGITLFGKISCLCSTDI